MKFGTKIIAEEDAALLLENKDFIESWYRLAKQDSSPTFIQEFPFASTWYRQYADVYSPVLCIGEGHDGGLVR